MFCFAYMAKLHNSLDEYPRKLWLGYTGIDITIKMANGHDWQKYSYKVYDSIIVRRTEFEANYYFTPVGAWVGACVRE